MTNVLKVKELHREAEGCTSICCHQRKKNPRTVISLHTALMLKTSLLGSEGRVGNKGRLKVLGPRNHRSDGIQLTRRLSPARARKSMRPGTFCFLLLIFLFLPNMHMAKSPRSQLVGLKNSLFPSTKAISSSCVCCWSRLPCMDTGNSVLWCPQQPERSVTFHQRKPAFASSSLQHPSTRSALQRT